MLLLENLPLFCSIFIVKIILIQGHKHFYKERTSKSFLGSLSFLKSSHDKLSIDSPIIDSIVDSFKFFIAKYIKENLQKILRTVLETRILSSNKLYKKLLKAKSPDVYCGKFHIEYYNFYQ